MDERSIGRRSFLALSTATGGVALLGPALAAQQRGRSARGATPSKDEGEEDVAPPEDLMREHGVLNRVLLIYEEAIRRIDARQDLPPDALRHSADIIRTLIEEYHEKLEEDYLFPRFEAAKKLVDLTTVLRQQHEAGRRVTERITQLATAQTLKNPTSAASLKDALHQFTRMYRPHETREDTVLFPALRGVVSKHEFEALGEEFEKKEHTLFGQDGFEKVVEQVASI
jgi:hemerythrin-like domain-containing protein